MPNVAESPVDLLASLSGVARIADGRLVIDDEARFRSEAAADLAWTAAFTKDDPTAEAARWIVWEASQALGARSASIHDLYLARGRGEVSGFTVPAINIRAQTFDMARTFFETAAARRRRRRDLRARAERADLHVPAADGLRDVRPRGRDRGRLASARCSSRATTTSSTRRSTPADPEAMTEEIRRACRLAVDAGYRNIDIDSSTLVDLSQARPGRGAARELPPRRGAHRAHPRPRDRRGDDQRRRRDRRGRQAELDGRRARGVPRRLRPRAGRTGARRVGAVEGQRPDRDVATAACRCPAAGSPRSSSTSRCCASSARSPGPAGWPARSSTAPRRCPTSCSTASRRSRRPRSTSRPASRTRSTSTPRSRPSLMDEI